MSTAEHPRFTQHSYGGQQQKTLITTYDLVSTSPSKLKYSFGDSKSIRFPKFNPCKSKGHDQVGYTLPTTKSSRGAGFGIGDRFNGVGALGRGNKSPSPDRYSPPTLFKPNNTTSTFAVHCVGDKTYSFGTGRESYKTNVLTKEQLKPDPAVPGPGTYDPLAPIGTSALSFKLKHKLYYGAAEQIALKRAVPGAGTYNDQLSLNNVGQYNQNSEWSNSKAQRWAPAYDRFKHPKTQQELNPGPGQHDQYGELQHGSQVNSQYHTIKSPTFGYGERTKYVGRFKTPGPGTYRAPSDFGYVDVMANNVKDRNDLALQTYGFSLDRSDMNDGSIASRRGSVKNKSMIQYYETIPEFGTSRNRFMNKTFVTHGNGKKKVSVTANHGTRIKKNIRGNSEFMNHTPKAKRAQDGDQRVFYNRNKSVAQTVLKNDRMQESERIQSQTFNYDPSDRQRMNETQKMPENIHEIQEHMHYRTPHIRDRQNDDEIHLTRDEINAGQRVQSDMFIKKPLKSSVLGTDHTTQVQTPSKGETRE